MFCKECGKELPDGALFCDECGTKVEDVDGTEEYVSKPDLDETVPITPIEQEGDNGISSGVHTQQDNSNVQQDNMYGQQNNMHAGQDNIYNQQRNTYSQQTPNNYNNGVNYSKPKKKSKAPIIATIVIVLVIIIGAASYAGFTVIKQKDVESTYESVKNKIDSEKIILSQDSKEKLSEANKNIASWNIFTLNGTKRQLNELKETVDKVADATSDLKTVQEKFDKLKKEEDDKLVYCENEKDKVQETLDDLKESVNSNNVQAIDSKKKEVEDALDAYEDAIDKAYEENLKSEYANNNTGNNDNSSSSNASENSNENMAIDVYVFDNTDTVEYTKEEMLSCFDTLDLSDDEKYAMSIIALNEIYARNGAKFTTDSLQQYFDGCTWYTNNNISTSDVSLSKIEAKNIENLSSIREDYWKNCVYSGLVDSKKPSAGDFSTAEYNAVMKKGKEQAGR